MSSNNFDPLIRREFEALGVNMVGNDLLADIVFEKVRRRRIRKWIIALGAAIALFAIIAIGYFVGNSSLFGSGKSVIQSNSYSQDSADVGVLALPQFARMNVERGNDASRHAIFPFRLRMGQMIEIFAQPKGAQGGLIAELTVVYRDSYGGASEIQKFPIGPGVGVNEFGDIAHDGIYEFHLDFTDINYQGQTQIGFMIGHQSS